MKFRALTSSSVNIALIVVMAFASAAFAQTITTFDVPNSTGTIPRGINKSGEIAGDYLDANGRFGGFLQQQDGSFITLNLFIGSNPSRWQTRGVGLNDSGSMIGYITIAGAGETGYIRKSDGTVTFFNNGGDVPPAAQLSVAGEPAPLPECVDAVEPMSINEAGRITGSVHCTLGFLRKRNGNQTSFRVTVGSDAADTLPQAINDQGQIAGYYAPQSFGVTSGFLRHRNGNVITFDVPGAIATRAKVINDSSQIAGNYDDANFVSHAFLRQPDGSVIPFDPVGSISTQVTGINKKGEITGFYATADGIYHGFVRKQSKCDANKASGNDGCIESFDAPGTTNAGTFPQGINDHGEVVGYFQDANFVLHGFVRSKR